MSAHVADAAASTATSRATRWRLGIAQTHPGFRSDIEGLRAVAVVAVIFNHLFGWPSGGFAGVDIFFVISGFLITGLLLKEHQTEGRISISSFYRRRIRRIIPAATLVLVATCAATYLIFNIGRSRSVNVDAIWAFFFAANWHQALVGADYFQADGLISPLQHYWSLAVEEQFYLAWPLLLIAMLGWSDRSRLTADGARRFVTVAMAVIVAGSLAYALWDTSVRSSFAYYSTASRAWELGVGALIALLTSRLAILPRSIRSAMALSGLGAVAASFIVLGNDSPVPAPGAVLPVLGAAAIVASGIGGEATGTWLLTNPVSGYLGRISYSLYLWHLPAIVVLAAFFKAGDPIYLGVAICLTFMLAAASFHLIENPIRRSRWLEPQSHGRRWNRPSGSVVLASGAISALVVVTILLVGPTDQHGADATPPSSTEGSTPSVLLQKQISEAIAAKYWPELTPSVADLGPPAKAPEWVKDGCLGDDVRALADPQTNASRCVYGASDSTKTAVLLGDSIAISYLPGLRAALEPQGWQIRVLTMQQCPAESVAVMTWKHEALPKCGPFRAWSFAQVALLKPDLVVLSSAENTLGRLNDGAKGDAALAEWEVGLNRSLTTLRGSAAHIVVLSAPPLGPNLQACATRISVPMDCISHPSATRANISTIEQSVVGSEGASITYLDDKAWFCDASGRCPSFVAGMPVYADGAHLTARYSTYLSGVLADLLHLAAVSSTSQPDPS